MTLGENISRLRTERHMSQGDLAEELDVSRQSVSKWENDGSVPDLDKLLRLSQLFGVTLDQLVRGEEGAEPPQQEEKAEQAKTSVPVGWIAAGAVLLTVGLLGFVFLLAFSSGEAGVFKCCWLLSLAACGLILLLIRKHTFLWCIWAVCLPQQYFWAYAGGLSWWMAFITPYRWWEGYNRVLILVVWLLLVAVAALVIGTLRAFRSVTIPPKVGYILLLLLLWGLAVVCLRYYPFWDYGVREEFRVLGGLLQPSGTIFLTAALTMLTAMFSLVKGKK